MNTILKSKNFKTIIEGRKTYFAMPKETFNTIINDVKEVPSIVKEGTTIKVALVIRTRTTNRILVKDNAICFVAEHQENTTQIGYFRCIESVLNFARNELNIKNEMELQKSILMPVGVFEHDRTGYIYLTLIINDDIENLFISNQNYKFMDLNKLNTNDERSIIVLPTIPIVEKN